MHKEIHHNTLATAALVIVGILTVLGSRFLPIQATLLPAQEFVNETPSGISGPEWTIVEGGYGLNAQGEKHHEETQGKGYVYWWTASVPTAFSPPTSEKNFRIFATWQPMVGGIARPAVFKTYLGPTYSREVAVDVAKTPTGITDKGVVWQEIGSGALTNPLSWNQYLYVELKGDAGLSVDAIKVVIDKCGDGACVFGENSHSCPADCPVAPQTTCGNGICTPTAGEQCDVGSPASGSGCTTACTVEPGWRCSCDGTGQSLCGRCGDGIIQGQNAETCDDTNATDGDGCSATCTIEAGWSCGIVGAPCTKLCGNGIDNPGEICDMGTANGGEYCTAECTKTQKTLDIEALIVQNGDRPVTVMDVLKAISVRSGL
ncbi:MAG: myxococcus cysteine-rich repeat containing protein [Candidatus Peregrinibacteria bacterium]